MTCGNCVECCRVFPIEEIQKPKHILCINCSGKDCNVYTTRPDACKNFNCAFLVGNWREELRPDKCGVIIYRDKKDGYLALRLRDNINPVIMAQIKFIQKKYNVTIKGIDAR